MTHTKPLILASLALAALFTTAAQAESLTEDFQSPLGDVPSDWTIIEAAGTNQNISAWSNGDAASPANGLLFSRKVSGGIGANAYYGGKDADDFSDFSGSVLLQLGAGNSTHVAGVLMRTVSSFDGTTTFGYFAGIHRAFVANVGWQYRVFISLDPQSFQSPGLILDSTDIRLAGGTNNTFRLEFSARGPKLSATVFQWNPDSSEWTNLGSASVSDDVYSKGFLGLRGGFGHSDGEATFGELTVAPLSGR